MNTTTNSQSDWDRQARDQTLPVNRRRFMMASDSLLVLAGMPQSLPAADQPGFQAAPKSGPISKRLGCFRLKEIREWTPSTRPAFLHIFLGNWLKSLAPLELVVEGLGSEYRCVRPDQLPRLYQATNP